MHFYAASLWEQGNRDENEDSIAILNICVDRTPIVFAVVADGIGGLKRGEDASSMVTYSLKMAVENASRTYSCLSLGYMKRLLLRELYKCHGKMKETTLATGEKMGTTCSLIMIVAGRGFVIHVGDSRVYRLRSSGKKNGLLTKDMVTGHKLCRCIGTGSYYRPQIRKIRVRNMDGYLLCTDGFYKRQEGEIMDACTDELNAKEWLHEGYNACIRRGEGDNGSAVLIICS